MHIVILNFYFISKIPISYFNNGRNDFAKVSKNLVRYRSENNFVEPSK